jgi:hypothetical protein
LYHLQFPRFALITICLVSFCRLGAADDRLLFSSENGAAVEFVADGEKWRWSGLTTLGRPGSTIVFEHEAQFAAGDGADVLAGSWSFVTRDTNRLVFEQRAPNSGLDVRRVFSFGPARHVLRIETWVRSLDGPKLLHRAGLLTLSVDQQAFRITGPSPASFPVFGQGIFAGIEDICGESRADGATFQLWQTPDVSVADEWQPVAAVVVGWQIERAAPFLPGESRTREAFLQYLDTIRVVPADINLHSDTWWTLPLPFSEADILRDIAALRSGFFERTGMFFNTYALDLGWSDPKTLWGIDARNFPSGLGTINARLAEMGCKMGMWVSPSSGYAPGLDNQWLEAQGYEMTPVGPDEKVACFALGGRYQREFTERIVGYAREYSLGHVIFDGLMHSCDDPKHLHATGVGSVYSIDAGFKEVMNRLRLLNPNIVLEPLSCGHPPSPWWNMHTPFLLGPAGDDVPYGRVPCPDWTESLTSARDIAYRAGQENWLVRTQALETFDIIVQSPGTFENMAVMAAGRGRWFISANIKPELMEPSHWDFLAALVRWQRANKSYLVDARMIGGSPARREAYGYMFHHADRDLYCIRNPWVEERTIRLPARVSEARDVRSIYPRRSRIARIHPNEDGVDITLAPYETMFLETIPEEGAPLAPESAHPVVAIDGTPSEEFVRYQTDESSRIDYRWRGSVVAPAVMNQELWVLVEGAGGVENAQGSVKIDGRTASVTRKQSAGQFGAAVDASPENWTWLITSLTAGRHEIEITLDVPLARASIAVYVKGAVAAHHDSPAGEPAVFPSYQPEQKAWSSTLRSLHLFGEAKEEATAAAATGVSGGTIL